MIMRLTFLKILLKVINMNVLKAAAFVQLQDYSALNKCPGWRRSVNSYQSLFVSGYVASASSLTSPPRRRRRLQWQSLLSIQSAIDDDNGDEDGNNNDYNGLYIDLETYLQAEETLLRPDGSLISGPTTTKQNQIMQSLFPPTYSYLDTKQEQDFSDDELLLGAVTDIQNNKSAPTEQQQQIDAESLHQQVFAEEQVYLEQSDEFRKSLTNNLHTNGVDEYENPIAKSRREDAMRYNQEILNGLMKDLEEMEASAISREEAMSRAKAGSSLNADALLDMQTATNVFCSQCGLEVTPDMIQRATYGPQEVICHACYSMKLRIKDEANVRVATGPFFWDSSLSPSLSASDKKILGSKRRRIDKLRMNTSSALDRSSLFRIPDNRIPRDQNDNDLTLMGAAEITKPLSDGGSSLSGESKQNKSPISDRSTKQKGSNETPTKVVENTRPFSGSSLSAEMNPAVSNRSTKQEIRPTAPRLVGGRALERRKLHQQTVDEGGDKNQSNDGYTREAKPDEISSSEWVKVEDSVSKRIMYWNKQTGEMKGETQ